MNPLKISPADTDKLLDLIKDVKVAMITTVAPDRTLRSRPMASPRHAFDGDLWFFTAAEAPKVAEVAADSQVNVSFSEPQDERYVSIAGRATVVRDDARAREMWSPLLKAWFPGGPDDPRVALLRVELAHVEYWDAKASKMQVFFSLAKAALGGGAPEHLGEHRKIG